MSNIIRNLKHLFIKNSLIALTPVGAEIDFRNIHDALVDYQKFEKILSIKVLRTCYKTDSQMAILAQLHYKNSYTTIEFYRSTTKGSWNHWLVNSNSGQDSETKLSNFKQVSAPFTHELIE